MRGLCYVRPPSDLCPSVECHFVWHCRAPIAHFVDGGNAWVGFPVSGLGAHFGMVFVVSARRRANLVRAFFVLSSGLSFHFGFATVDNVVREYIVCYGAMIEGAPMVALQDGKRKRCVVFCLPLFQFIRPLRFFRYLPGNCLCRRSRGRTWACFFRFCFLVVFVLWWVFYFVFFHGFPGRTAEVAHDGRVNEGVSVCCASHACRYIIAGHRTQWCTRLYPGPRVVSSAGKANVFRPSVSLFRVREVPHNVRTAK